MRNTFISVFSKRPLAIDCAVALTIFVIATVEGHAYWKRRVSTGQPFYYQSYFEPAVMFACGKGYVVARPQVQAMLPFLTWRQADSFSCDTIPRDAVLGTEDMFQQGSWLYLMLATGLTWRIFGVSWSALGPLFALLFATTLTAAYGVFRLGMRHVLAVAGTVALGVSAMHLKFLPSLRDYSKAPFMIALMFLLGLVVARRWGWRSLVAISTAYGAVAGIGYGFRTDFAGQLPPFILVVFVFLSGGLFANLRLKTAAAAACVGGFVVASWPVISTIDRARPGCQWHVVQLGFASQFSSPLGIEPAPYEVSRQYLDEYAHTTVTSYAGRVHPGIGRLDYCEAGHGAATSEFLGDVVRRFPADIMARGYASVLRIVELPLTGRQMVDDDFDRTPVYNGGRGFGIAVTVIAIALATTADVRIGAFLLFFLLYYAGLPALQFDPRHFFHLEIVGWWAAGFVLQRAIDFVRSTDRRTDWVAVRRAGVLLAGCAGALVAALWLARGYQQTATRKIFTRYLTAPREAIPLDPATAEPQAPVRVAPHTDPETADFIIVDVNASRCGDSASVAFQYEDNRRLYSRTFLVPHDTTPGLAHVFMPIYDGFRRMQFDGVRRGCIDGVYRIRDVAPFTLLLEAQLPPDWKRAAFYQRLKPYS